MVPNSKLFRRCAQEAHDLYQIPQEGFIILVGTGNWSMLKSEAIEHQQPTIDIVFLE
jgi:hypothetical protein